MNVYQVLKRPILTEKTDFQRDDNQYVFEVNRGANKLQIKKPKRRRMGRKMIATRSAWKRAVVTLAPGEQIQEFFEGI